MILGATLGAAIGAVMRARFNEALRRTSGARVVPNLVPCRGHRSIRYFLTPRDFSRCRNAVPAYAFLSMEGVPLREAFTANKRGRSPPSVVRDRIVVRDVAECVQDGHGNLVGKDVYRAVGEDRVEAHKVGRAKSETASVIIVPDLAQIMKRLSCGAAYPDRNRPNSPGYRPAAVGPFRQGSDASLRP